MKSIMTVNEFGKVWKNEKGEFHRKDGPAMEYANGDKYWCLNGQLHREDGPAIEYVNGSKYWHLNGQRHREGGPAIEFSNGDKYWYLNGQLHREDGPAVEYVNGDKYYYLNDKEYTEKEFLEVDWQDTDDEWSKEIDAARSGSHDEYAIAMKMVGNRHSKKELVALVNWLLLRLKNKGNTTVL